MDRSKFLFLLAASLLIILAVGQARDFNSITESTVNTASASESYKTSLNQGLPYPISAKLYKDNFTIRLMLADTVAKQDLGLGKIKSLPNDVGMLFVFSRPELVSIWMKDMNFPIDIIWLDQNFKIIDLRERISPDTFPQTFTPTQKSTYVLEVRSGFVSEAGIKTGETLKIIKSS